LPEQVGGGRRGGRQNDEPTTSAPGDGEPPDDGPYDGGVPISEDWQRILRAAVEEGALDDLGAERWKRALQEYAYRRLVDAGWDEGDEVNDMID
jgi:hypothetical protein